MNVDRCGRAPPTLGVATPGQMVLGCGFESEQAEQATGDKPEEQRFSVVSASVLLSSVLTSRSDQG